MSFRMVEAVVPARYEQETRQLIKEHGPIDFWEYPTSESRIVFRLLLEARDAEPLLDQLEKYFDFEDEFRVVVTPVEAAYPWDSSSRSKSFTRRDFGFVLGRISRQELYQDIHGASGLTPMFIAMVVLSTVVACVGLLRDNSAVIIGAMVIAPLLGPNAALSLATTIGDRQLALRAILSSTVGVAVAFAMAAMVGYWVDVDLTIREIVSRTSMTISDLGVALAAGVAGSLAFTTGVPANLVGVMVAVALLPPTVVLGMLAGSQQWEPALGAGLILVANVTALNATGVGTFLLLGLRPRITTKGRGPRRLAILALCVWIAFLYGIAYLILQTS